MIDPKTAIADIDNVLDHDSGTSGTAASSEVAAMRRACIERWAPAGSSYVRMAEQIDPCPPKYAKQDVRLRGVLVTLRRDYERGMVKTFQEMVHASMFDDLLGQAQGLLEDGYRLPAAVVAGASLESHLRELAGKHCVDTVEQRKNKPVGRTASALNDDLHAKAKAYITTEFRQVQVWIDLRNEAAHGKPEFQNRTEHDVSAMITGIREFMVRNPA